MQSELFENFQPEGKRKRIVPPLFPHQFVRFRVAYEDVIFSVLSLILVLLAGFCIGVERGKQLGGSADRMERVEAVGQAVLSRPEENPVKAVQVIQRDKQQSARETSEAAVSAAAVPEGPYVIQLASYVGVHSAQAEADRLRRQGFNPRVIKQGKYYELRVVGYRSKMEAMDKLATLRKTYHDGFVKRLSSS